VTIYVVKACTEDGEILIQLYTQEQHAERHQAKLLDSRYADQRRMFGVTDVRVYAMKVAEDYDGPA
jgi:hypothetical protein